MDGNGYGKWLTDQIEGAAKAIFFLAFCIGVVFAAVIAGAGYFIVKHFLGG